MGFQGSGRSSEPTIKLEEMAGMSSKYDGGTAFPCEQSQAQDGTWNQAFDPGMTLRDYFAGQALAEIAESNRPAACAKWAYQIADAMLAERAKE